MIVKQVWDALSRRDLDTASQRLDQLLMRAPDDGEALSLRAYIAQIQGNLDEAEQLLFRAAQTAQAPMVPILRALVMGERGHRAEAAKRLQELIGSSPLPGFARAALAEQRIRQGYWNDGATLFIEALQLDQSGLCRFHLREVLGDMSQAIHAGKLPPEEPIKMLNRISAASSKEIAQMLAVARRSLEARQPIDRSRMPLGQDDAPLSEPAESLSLKEHMKRAKQTRRDEPSPSDLRHHEQRREAQQRDAQRVQRQGEERSLQLVRMKVARDAREAQAQSPFMQGVQQERALNEQLLELIEPLPLSQWPSQITEPLDYIPKVLTDYKSITEQLADYRELGFHVTQGNIYVQIYMERCFNALTALIPTELTGPLALQPPLFTFLELNLLDGSLTTDLQVVTHDLSEEVKAEHGTSALAYFLGESLARAHHGSWTYTNPVESCQVYVNGTSFTPYALVKRWLSSAGKEIGEVYALIDALAHDRHNDSLSHQSYEYIDMTSGLGKEALELKLAELWSLYRFRLARTPSVEVARGLKMLEERGEVIFFELEPRLSVKPPREEVSRGAARPKTNRITYAYVRSTGEFMMTCRPALMARVLARSFTVLDERSAPEVLRLIRDHFLPGATFIERDEDAAQVAKLTNNPAVTGPRHQRTAQGAALTFWMFADRRVTPWQLRTTPDREHGTWRWELVEVGAR